MQGPADRICQTGTNTEGEPSCRLGRQTMLQLADGSGWGLSRLQAAANAHARGSRSKGDGIQASKRQKSKHENNRAYRRTMKASDVDGLTLARCQWQGGRGRFGALAAVPARSCCCCCCCGCCCKLGWNGCACGPDGMTRPAFEERRDRCHADVIAARRSVWMEEGWWYVTGKWTRRQDTHNAAGQGKPKEVGRGKRPTQTRGGGESFVKG